MGHCKRPPKITSHHSRFYSIQPPVTSAAVIARKQDLRFSVEKNMLQVGTTLSRNRGFYARSKTEIIAGF
jgi:hypothetical protein